MTEPELSIIIVSWNVKDLLKKCLESIFASQGNFNSEVIVVDNASTDRTAEMVRVKFPQVKFLANEKNIGYAAANNLGFAQSSGKYILFLNPDTVILDNTLEKMLEFVKGNDKIAIAGCKHLNPDKTLQPSIRRFPTVTAIVLILLKIAKIFPDLPALRHYFARDFDYNRLQIVDQVAGSFFFTKREILQKIGPFDEQFFTWFEEVDLCRRAKAAGWQVWYNPTAEIIHVGGQSFKQQLVLKNQKIFFQSAWRYFRKNGFGG